MTVVDDAVAAAAAATVATAADAAADTVCITKPVLITTRTRDTS